MFVLQAEIFAELGEVVKGVKPAHCEKTTVFKSLGKNHRSQDPKPTRAEEGLPLGEKEMSHQAL